MTADGEVTRRQPTRVQSAPSSGGGYYSGYSTDESTDGAGGDNNNKERRARRKPKLGGAAAEKDGGKGSMLWLVLSIGLIFCLLDAAYISRVLDRPMQKAANGGYSAGGGSRSVLQANGIQDLSHGDEDRSKQVNFLGDNNGKGGGGRRRTLSPEEKERREVEKKKAEEDRIQKIKMAALEALKAENGGKLPKDVEDKYLENDEAFKPRPMSEYHDRSLMDDKQKVLQLFTEAGLREMDDSTYAILPTWGEVTRLYGSEPKIMGLDQCDTFQNKGQPWEHFVSTAGMFNSGTNLMAEMLIHNCHMQARMDKLGAKNRGIRWQVPWGKHTPPGDEEYRLNHKSKKDSDVDATMILPAVTVRDPYYWMQSMCKHHYTASWRGSDRCPNLTPSDRDKANYPMLRDKDHFPLRVKYADFDRHHESLTGLWNDWYNEYKNVEFHRLFVRYEDLLFHPKQVAETVCKCAGGEMNRGKFQYVVDSAKKGVGAHGSVRTGYIDAIIKYGSERHRYNGYHPEDLKYAREHLDKEMMEDFGYKFHPIELEDENDKKHLGEHDAGNEHEDEEEEGAGEADTGDKTDEENKEENGKEDKAEEVDGKEVPDDNNESDNNEENGEDKPAEEVDGKEEPGEDKPAEEGDGKEEPGEDKPAEEGDRKEESGKDKPAEEGSEEDQAGDAGDKNDGEDKPAEEGDGGKEGADGSVKQDGDNEENGEVKPAEEDGGEGADADNKNEGDHRQSNEDKAAE